MTSGADSGSVPYSVGAVGPGTYELRLFHDRSYAHMAISGPIMVL
jgi:hypothetical protein